MLTLLILSYLIGSIPFAYIISWKCRKVDIRNVGSQNVGSTNVYRQVGIIAGVITAILDACKGIAAVMLGRTFGSDWEFVALIAAMVGHIWPIWLAFHGGGGLATFIGGMLLVSTWWVILIILAVWGIAYKTLKKHDQSALLACCLSPVIMGLAHSSWAHFIFGMGAAFVVGIKRAFSIRKNRRSLIIHNTR